MFKKILFSTAFVFAAAAGMAQPVFIDSVDRTNVGRIYRVGDVNEVYTYFIKSEPRSKNASLVVKIASPGQQEPRSFAVEVDKNTVVLSTAASQMAIAFLTYNTATKSCSLFSVDFGGRVSARVTVQGLPAEQMSWDNDLRLLPVMPEGFMLVAPKAKKQGYAITAYDGDMKELWAENFDAKNNTLELVDIKQVGPEDLFMLRRELTDAKQQKYSYSLQVLSPARHAESVITDLKDKNNNYCFANTLGEKDGQVLVAGLCYKDGKYVQGLPTGISIYEVQPDGNINTSVFCDAQQLSKFLPDGVISAMATNSVLNLEFVVNNQQQEMYYIVAELVGKNIKDAKQMESKISVSDLMTLGISRDGELQKLAVAEKAPHIDIAVKGAPTNADMYGTVNWLNRNRLVNTRFVTQFPDGNYVCTKGTDTARHETEAVFIKIDNPTIANQFGIIMSRTESRDLGLKPQTRFNVNAGAADFGAKRWQQADVYMLRGMQFVFYNLADNKAAMFFDVINRRP